MGSGNRFGVTTGTALVEARWTGANTGPRPMFTTTVTASTGRVGFTSCEFTPPRDLSHIARHVRWEVGRED